MGSGRPPFSGVVLTGGASTRMGTDKALLPVGDRALVTVAATALRDAGAAEVLAVGGDLGSLGALGLDARPDDDPGEGPLGGILTALRLASADPVVVLACDMPGIDRATVLALVDALVADPSADVAAASDGGRVQPLTAAYRTRARPMLAEAFAAGERAVRRALAPMRVVLVDGLTRAALADVDRPEDLRRYAHPS
ncbi:MAG TPA: molybdenum cofactor guanylyltransferase [Acidimicrobiales bacterium]|nr:molybdenum cofactor guanylyltransferase [Acidimicrobiales bacterium]